MDFWLLLLAGCFLSLMQSLNGELSGYLGIFEVTFIVHSIGAVLLILYLKLVKRQKIRLRGIPPLPVRRRLFGGGAGEHQRLLYAAHRRGHSGGAVGDRTDGTVGYHRPFWPAGHEKDRL